MAYAPCAPTASTALYNVSSSSSSSWKLNAAIMSIFLPSNHFYLQKSWTWFIHVVNSLVSFKVQNNHRRWSVKKKVSLEISQKWQENTCASGLQVYTETETLAQVFSHEFYEISKNPSFTDHVGATASESFPLRSWNNVN